MTDPSGGSIPASWQADPGGRHQSRYWDGAQWTDSVADDGVTASDPLPSGAPGLSTPGGYGLARSGSHGPIGTPTSIGTQILLTILTLGIWSLVWTYRQYKQFKDYSGEGLGGGIGLLLGIVIGIVTFFLLPMELTNNLYGKEGRESPVQPIAGLWVLLPIAGPIIWYVKVQHAINDFWVSKGAAPV